MPADLAESLGSGGGDREVTFLDVGAFPVTASACAEAIRAIADGRANLLATDRNSTCYLLPGQGMGAGAEAIVVKVPRRGPQRTNADTTFAGEAAILARLPAVGIANASRLVARIVAGGEHYLFVSHLEGEHPDPVACPLDDRHLAAMVDSLSRMDERGLMHYDLKAANVLVAGDGIAFLDFEFACFEPQVDVGGSERQDFGEDFNVAGNPYLSLRSNVANFEFRTLYRYCRDLAAAHSTGAAATFFRQWLIRRAESHARRAVRFDDLGTNSADRFGTARAGTAAQARRRLAAAAAHERLAAALLACPTDRIAALEWALVVFRHHVFERRGPEARALRTGIDAFLGRWRETAGDQVRPYVAAATRTVAQIARSRVPGGRSFSVDFEADAGSNAAGNAVRCPVSHGEHGGIRCADGVPSC